MTDLPHLLTRIESAEKASRELDFAIALASGLYQLQEPEGGREEGDTTQYVRYVHPSYKTVWSGSIGACVPEITASVDAARAFVDRLFPDFWVTSGLCSLTGHASIGPDYNGPNGDRLRQEWPEEKFHEGFSADLAPGDGQHRECLAILHCAVQALITKGEEHV